MTRLAGERIALNTPIQGTAADIMKIAMIKTQLELIKNNIDAKIVLQIHDELVLECAPEHAEEAKKTVAEIAATQFTPGTSCEVVVGSFRPPMEKRQETLDLFEKLQSLCRQYDLGTLTPFESGGGSDSCYIQMAGVTSICGMGAIGGRQHSPEEFLDPKSIALRAKILVAYCWDSL